MKIAFDYQVFTMQPYGGISRYFSRVAEQLLAGGSDVHLFPGIHRNFYLENIPVAAITGRRVNSYLPKVLRIMQAYNRISGKYAMKRWRPDVVHETYYSGHSSGPCGSASVITVYDMIHELYPESFSAKDRTAEIKRAAIGRADHVICISESTRNDLVRLYSVPDNKISVVHLGFERFSSASSVIGEAVTDVRPFLLYVGSRAGYKNFLGLLKAVSSSERLLADFDIVAFGGGPFSVAELALIKTCGFKDNQVRHVGGGDSVLGALYKGARAFVYPSLYEGFGLPPLEAMAHSCPVISSNTSSMPEVIGNAGAFFDPLFVEDMAAAIERVVYDSDVISRLQVLGHERLEQFSWQRCAAETLSIYQSLQR